MYYFTSNLPLHAFFIHGSVWYADVFRAEQVQRLRDQFWWHTWEKGTWLSALLFPKQTPNAVPTMGWKADHLFPDRCGCIEVASPGDPPSLSGSLATTITPWTSRPKPGDPYRSEFGLQMCLKLLFPHVLHVFCCAGGSQTPEARWSFSSVHRWKMSEVLFPLIRNGRRESSLFWVLCNQHQLFRTASLWQIIFLCGEIKSNFLI